MRCRLCGSTPTVGSSSSRIRGSCMITRSYDASHQKTSLPDHWLYLPTRSLQRPTHRYEVPDVSNHETCQKPPVLSSRQITVQRYLLRTKPICCLASILFRVAPQKYFTVVSFRQSGKTPNRCLARSIGAEKGQTLASHQAECYAFQCLQITKCFFQIMNCQCWSRTSVIHVSNLHDRTVVCTAHVQGRRL